MAHKNDRPTSPHLQIYKLPPTGIISISHRITGVLLSFGLIFFVGLLLSVAGGPDSFETMQNLMRISLLQLIYWGFIYALFFHLCHGIRHLIWDAGQSFDRETMNRFVMVELAASILLTLVVFVFLS
ncbi:MAG: succinate dehydrogenase, cytochrome b556 subunit [Methylococcaceae bacterium]|nr:succinate dehydrogenase, cytochrome b556 subunit [Methylococcaceae bacterium]